jgi:Mg-chelatase subunit ChlD
MKTIPMRAVLTALAALVAGTTSLRAADDDGVALAIVYDTSGSMRENVRDSNGKPTPKYIIADRALVAVARQIQACLTNTASGTPRKIQAALFTFQGDQAKEVIKMGPFDPKAIQDWAERFTNPNGGTPLGRAVEAAAKAVLDSPLPRKHVLVITDGVNTQGPKPDAVIPELQHRAGDKPGALSIHFIAFDVAAKIFDPVKKLGATVVGAADEKQLNTQLDYILQKKILLEEEDPPKTK